MTSPPALALALGRRMRALRDKHGVTADSIAAQARRIGLNWQRSTVATIEAGRRRLTGEELLLLPLVLSMALPVNVTLHDLLDQDMALTDELVMTPTGFRQLLSEGTPIWGGYRLQSQGRTEGQVERVSSAAVWRRIEQLWPDVHGRAKINLHSLRAVERGASGDAEQNVARTLGVSAVDVSAVAHRLWGHSLTEERERRVAGAGGAGGSAAASRVRRGHITRSLLEEVASALSASPGGSDAPT